MKGTLFRLVWAFLWVLTVRIFFWRIAPGAFAPAAVVRIFIYELCMGRLSEACPLCAKEL